MPRGIPNKKKPAARKTSAAPKRSPKPQAPAVLEILSQMNDNLKTLVELSQPMIVNVNPSNEEESVPTVSSGVANSKVPSAPSLRDLVLQSRELSGMIRGISGHLSYIVAGPEEVNEAAPGTPAADSDAPLVALVNELLINLRFTHEFLIRTSDTVR